MITAKTKCRCCGLEFVPGRRSKTYCSNACKQTAYYHRRKSSDTMATSDAQVVTETGGVTESAVSVTNRNTLSVTTSDNQAAHQDFPVPLIPEDNCKQSQDWNTDNPSNTTLQMEHYTHSDEEKNTAGNEPEAPASINVMGMQVDKDWFTDLLETLPEEEQRQLSRLLLEAINDTFPDLIEEFAAPYSDDDDGDSYETEDSDGPEETAEASPKVYRLGVSEESGDSGKSDFNEDADYRGHLEHRPPRNNNNDYTMSLTSRNNRGHMGSYLKRFASSRIRQGLTIWEELSVTIPSFMEGYVLDFATNAAMLVHPADGNKGGLVTVHILFHLAQHRRTVCRLLDLVLEAEDGTLTKEDFVAGGAFAIYEESEEEQYNDDYDNAGEIDYDCFDRSNQSRGRLQTNKQRTDRQYVSARDIAMYHNTSGVMQLVRSDTSRRA